MAKMKAKQPAKAVKPSAQPNKFETLYNRKKFNVLGKKTKGDKQARGKARSDGTEKRKSTLLVEYKQRQRANAFIDRRFGEDDASLTADDRAIARFQKQRLKEFAGDKYNLADATDGEQLTHLGAALADNADFVRGGSFDGDDGEDMGYDTVDQLHFGGGFERKASQAGEEEPQAPKSKKEVMEEIIAKSKKHKAEKAKQRDADLDATEALDRDLAELMKGRALRGLIRPKGVKPKFTEPLAGEDAAFDVARRELVFEAKAKVGERTRTAEEMEQAELARLQRLEKQRQMRMSGDDAVGPGAVEGDQTEGGGYAQRRAKRRRQDEEREDASGSSGESDSEDEGDSEDESDSEESEGKGRKRRKKLSLDERRAEQAAGDHPLQQRFQELAGQLLHKHTGGKEGKAAESEDKFEGLDASGDESGDELDGEGDSSESGSEEEGSVAEEDGADLAEEGSGSEDDDAEMEEEAESDELADSDDLAAAEAPGGEGQSDIALRKATVRHSVSEGAVEGTMLEELPFTIPTPPDYEAFLALVGGRGPADLDTAVRRIRITNKARLAAGSKQGLQAFYGIVLQHFASLAGATPPPLAHLDALVPHLLELTAEVPLYAATAALARLRRLRDRVSAVWQDPSEDGSAWPTVRQLLLLKLWTAVFQASDRRHPVLTPAAVLMGACLTLSPVRTRADAISGLFLASLSLHMASTAERLMPEPLTFAVDLLRAFRSQGSPSGPQESPGGWSLPFSLPSEEAPLPAPQPLSFAAVEGPAVAGGGEGGPSLEAFTSGCLAAAVGLIGRAADVFAGVPSFPELFSSASAELSELEKLGAAVLSEALHQAVVEARHKIEAQCTSKVASRVPLRKEKLKKEIKQFNPRFEEDFAQGKDYDVDRDRAESRKLKRLVSKERRGAVRELRKDALFLGEQDFKEKEARKADARKALRTNSAWLAKQEQDFKSGGQGGMWKRKKGKK